MNPTEGLISEAFDLYKKHFGHLVVTALVVYVVVAVVGALLALIGGALGFLLALILSFVASYLLQAALVEAVADIRDGRADLTVGETLSRGASRVGSVIGASLIAGIAIVIGLILLIVPGLVLITWFSVIVPVIVLEHVGVFDSFTRSRNLVRGFDFQVFGVIVLAVLIYLAFGIVLTIVLSPLPESAQAFVSQIASGTLTGPFYALVVSLLYFRLKAAKEGPGTTPGPTAPPPAMS